MPTSVFYGEYLSRPTNMTTTPASEQMTSPFRDRSALVIGVPLGRTDTHSSAPARLDLAVEAPTSVIYGENHSRPDQHDHSAAEQTMYVYSPPSELAARSSLVSLYGERAPHSSAPALLDLAVEAPTSVIYGENHSRPDQHDHRRRRPEPDHVWPPVPSSSAFILGAPLR